MRSKMIQWQQIENLMLKKISIKDYHCNRLDKMPETFWQKLYNKYQAQELKKYKADPQFKNIVGSYTISIKQHFATDKTCIYIFGVDVNQQKEKLINEFLKDNPKTIGAEFSEYDGKGALFITSYDPAPLDQFKNRYWWIHKEKIRQLKTNLTKFKKGTLSVHSLMKKVNFNLPN